MNYPKKPSYCENLVVVNFWTKHLDETLRGWNEHSKVGYAETCNRQVWFGLEKDFRDFPQIHGNAIKRREGRDAYEFLLRLACGLESNRIGEDRIKGELFGKWDRYLDPKGKEKKQLQQMMEAIKADSRFVGETMTAMRQTREEIVARDLAGVKPGERILVIGDIDGQKQLARSTDGIMRVCGNERRTRIDTIALTHPDPVKLGIAYDEALKLHIDEKVTAKIEAVPFESLSAEFEKAARVFVDLPMGKNLAAEEEILYAWNSRIDHDNTLTSLRGSPEKMGMSIRLWSEAGLDNYIAPEDIRHEMEARVAHNAGVIERANKAIDYCASLRDEGKQPSISKVRLHLKQIDLALA